MFSFLAPWAFWIALAVIPPLILLYFLKLRRRTQPISSTFLWRRAVQELQVNAPFQRLRKNLLLLLQLLVLALGIFALARPIVESALARESSVVIVLDRSASMNAREADGQTRFEKAREQAVRLVRTFNQTGSRWISLFSGVESLTRVMVIACADRAAVISPFTTNTADVVDLIERIEPSDAPGNLPEALELAEAYMQQTRIEQTPGGPAEAPSSLVLISDGAVAPLGDVVLRSGGLRLIPIGETSDNLAITALRVQRNYENPELLSAYCQVQNFGPKPVTTDVSIYLDNRLETVRSVSLGPGAPAGAAGAGADVGEPGAGGGPGPGEPGAGGGADAGEAGAADAGASPDGGRARRSQAIAALSFEFPLLESAVLEARIARADALDADNAARVVVPPPRKLRVLLVSKANSLLESALRPLPLEALDYLTPEQYEAAPESQLAETGRSRYDVVVFDKHSTARLPQGAYLFIGAAPQIEPVRVTGEVGSFAMMWWDQTHPVLRHVALEYVYAAKGINLELPDEAQNLVEGPHGPVLARLIHDGRHYMLLGFAIEESTWWNKLSFPVFLYNATRFLGSGGATSEQGTLRPGDTLRIAAPPGAELVRVIRPDGHTEAATVDDGVARYGRTDQVGLYRVEDGLPGEERYAVNLEDPIESDIRPRTDLGLASGVEVSVGETIETATPEVWRWFVGAALAVVLLEWYVYNRRVML